VFEILYRRLGSRRHLQKAFVTATELPRRLFRPLAPKTAVNGKIPDWKEHDQPLPFLKYLYSTAIAPNPNSHDGYPLTKAVRAGFLPLIRFLLDHGASPGCKNALSIRVAIRLQDLPLVRMLIERNAYAGKGKKRKLPDRVQVSPFMLKTAVQCDARDIVEYFVKEKGCAPDLQTLQLLGQWVYLHNYTHSSRTDFFWIRMSCARPCLESKQGHLHAQ
jgi:hypothetical protein